MTSLEMKQKLVVATAKAFLARGQWVQYDQLSMDRLVRVTPRHDLLCTPEYATAQHTVYMDCAHFVCAVYYATFGVRLEADVTWNMLAAVKPRVYHRKLTGEETVEERLAIWEECKAIIQPGDAIVILREGAGHIILCGENDTLYECNHVPGPDSYRYADRHDTVTKTGGLFTRGIREMFDEHTDAVKGSSRVFCKATIEFAILRPLDKMGEPTPAAMLRLAQAEGLFCQVLSSHPGGMSVRRGDAVTYTVCVRNDSAEYRTVTAELTAPEHAALSGESARSCTLRPKERCYFAYTLRVGESCGAILEPPAITVNGLPLWAERCLVEGNVPAAELTACAKTLEKLLPETPDMMAAAARAYAPLGLFRPTSEETLRYLYWRYDSVCGDVLWRDKQNPEKDGVLYSYFGGTGVLTPEAGADMGLRTQHMTPDALRPGDIVLCADDALFTRTYGCIVTENGLLGRFDPDSDVKTLQDEDIHTFVDSLQGRFCYAVFRPAMIRR